MNSLEGPSLAVPSPCPPILKAGGAAVAYGLATMAGFALTLDGSPVAVLWPANAILLAALLLVPASNWRLVLPLVGIVHLVVQDMAGVPLRMASYWLFSNLLEAVLGAFLVRLMAQGIRIVSLRNLLLIIAVAAVAAPLVGSFVDVALLKTIGSVQHSAWELWQRRFLSNVAATMVFLPIVLTWDSGLLALARRVPPLKWMESGLLIAIMTALAFMMLADHSQPAERPSLHLYGLMLCILWAALRFPPFAASLGLPFFALMAVLNLKNSLMVDNHAVMATQLLIIAAAAPLLALLGLRQETQAMHRQRLHLGAGAALKPTPVGRTALEQSSPGHGPTPDLELEPPPIPQSRNKQHENMEQLGRVAMLGKLSAALAHELNQPLAAILSNAQAARRFLRKQPVDLQEIHEILDDIVNEDRRAGEVIHRLRELFLSGALKLQTLRLNDIVLEVIELTRADLIEREIEFALHLSPHHPEVLGDRVQLQQVLLNLVLNANEAIRSTGRHGGRMEIRTEICGANVNVIVSDNGPGIPPALLERVFDAFFTTKRQGMGCGLSISNTIVLQHGGHIGAINRPEGGACFTVALPRHKPIRKYF